MTVTTTELGQARLVVWDRQARRNAWTRETIEGIAAAVEAAGADESVRCVIVSGAGEHFSAGDDLFAPRRARRGRLGGTVAAFQRVTRAALAAPVPVLAAIDGVCIGGALEFAASCDLRIATDRARFGTPEVGIGLVATNAGTLLLPEVLGETAARELLLTGALRGVDWMRDTASSTRSSRRRVRGPHRALGRRVRRRLAHRRGAHQGDARRPPRRSPRRRDGARGARLRRALRRPDAPAALAAFAQRRR